MLIHQILEFAAAESPNSVALIAADQQWTFAELYEDVLTLAGAIGELTAPGDRVVVISDNCPVLLTALYAVPAAGALLTLGNTRHSIPELLAMIQSTQPSLLLASREQLDRLTPELSKLPFLRTVICMNGTHESARSGASLGLSTPTSESCRTHSGTSQRSQANNEAPSHIDPDRPAWLIHTSGTTGTAKGALLSHRSLLAATQNTAMSRPISAQDVYLFPFPLFHVAAYNVLHVHLRRRTVVLTPRFEAGEVLRLIQTHRVTTCSLAPTMLSLLLDHPERGRTDISSLRQISYGAAAMPLDLLRRVLKELPDCGLAQGYGMTELSGNAVFLDPESHRLAASTHPHLLAAAGKPGPLIALRIVNDVGVELPLGESGEILVQGDQICEGYYQAPEATAESRCGPWFATGDIGRIDEQGYLYIVDRKKDLIITGGENVASREVEDLISTHPQVAQVAVIGLPDDHWGEVVCAVVVADVVTDGSAVGATTINGIELIEWTRDKIAGFKRPRRVVQVLELPMNASGKVDKRLLRITVTAQD